MNLDFGGERRISKARATIFQAVFRCQWVHGDRYNDPQRVWGARAGSNRHDFMDFEGLVDGGQRMESVGAGRTQVKTQVDLRVGTYCRGHTDSL